MRRFWAVLLVLVALSACSSNVAGPGEACGGFTRDARQCLTGYTCVSQDGAPGDLPGTCQKND